MLLHFLDNGKFGNLEEFEAEFKNVSHEDQVSITTHSFSTTGAETSWLHDLSVQICMAKGFPVHHFTFSACCKSLWAIVLLHHQGVLVVKALIYFSNLRYNRETLWSFVISSWAWPQFCHDSTFCSLFAVQLGYKIIITMLSWSSTDKLRDKAWDCWPPDLDLINCSIWMTWSTLKMCGTSRSCAVLHELVNSLGNVALCSKNHSQILSRGTLFKGNSRLRGTLSGEKLLIFKRNSSQ